LKEFQKIYNTLLKYLIEYLFIYKQILIPGLGTFSIEEEGLSSNNDEPVNILDISNKTIFFDRKFEYKNYQLFNFLSDKLELSEDEVKKIFYQFSYYIQTELENNNYYNLDQIGELKNHLGQITLDQKPKVNTASEIVLNIEETIQETIEVRTISPADFVLSNREDLTRVYDVFKDTNESQLNNWNSQIDEPSLQNQTYPIKNKILIVKRLFYIIVFLIVILAIIECYLYMLFGKFILK